jgi:putative spermidine/putrescine transport system ATP-binding protein
MTRTISGSEREMPMIALENVSKSYGEVAALAAVDLRVEKGEFVSLLGPSGSGKTTLLNLIAGMIQPSGGRILIDGRDVTTVPPSQRGLGMVFQNYALMPHMTVFDNIAFPLRVRKVSRAEIARKVADVLDLVHLPHVAGRRPRELSGGQQQRISLARCIVYNPSIILMDEPLGALDKKLRSEMQIEISRLHRELGITILYVTHDQEEALTMSDRIVLMDKGVVAQVGTANDLYFQPCSCYVADFVGHSNLLTGQVIAADDVIEIALPHARVRAPRPDFRIQVGETATVLVRPESVTLSGQSGQSGVNCIAGHLLDTLIVGGIVKHFVSLADGSKFEVQELNRKDRVDIPRGSEVTISWQVGDGCVLPATGSVPPLPGSPIGQPVSEEEQFSARRALAGAAS